MKPNDLNKKNIIIWQVLMSAGKPRRVEFYSHSDSRNSIINVDRFCEIFGYKLEDVQNQQAKK